MNQLEGCDMLVSLSPSALVQSVLSVLSVRVVLAVLVVLAVVAVLVLMCEAIL